MKLSLYQRKFLPQTFTVDNWSNIEPYYDDLLNRKITDHESALGWYKDRSELAAVLEEDMAWRYIKMTGDTSNKAFGESFNYFVTEIQPKVAPFENALDKKVYQDKFLQSIDEDGFDILKRNIKKDIELYRESNIPLLTALEAEGQVFGEISGAMTIVDNEKEYTLQQASDFLNENDRSLREKYWLLIQQRRFEDNGKVDDLFESLIKKRHQVAKNADCENFRDYMFQSLGRFDYSKDDCFSFHEAVATKVVPVINALFENRKKALKVTELKPWDINVNYFGEKPLKPFSDGEDLLNKTIICFTKINPYLGECLLKMKEMGHLDLVSRKGKAPGGYNYPLDEIGVPFIFMNATSTLDDLVTMVHEGGHAFHNFLTRDLSLNTFKQFPSEVAELASMSMELISMEHWDVFFPNKEDYNRAKREHLESVLKTLPWVCTIDAFQHWVYENPTHTRHERYEAWINISSKFSSSIIDWKGLEDFQKIVWQKQLHLFEVPFYYIEYAMAQLGAIAVWKNYKQNPKQGFQQYQEALKLGNKKTIPEIYEVAGIKFDFSSTYIEELIAFVLTEIKETGLD